MTLEMKERKKIFNTARKMAEESVTIMRLVLDFDGSPALHAALEGLQIELACLPKK